MLSLFGNNETVLLLLKNHILVCALNWDTIYWMQVHWHSTLLFFLLADKISTISLNIEK